MPAATGRHDWIEGGQADAMLIDSGGRTVVTEHLTIAPGVSSLRFALGSTKTLGPGDYQVQIRAKGTAASLGTMESVRVSLATSPIASGAVVLRRSVTTGNQSMPTADLRFRRTERISVEVRRRHRRSTAQCSTEPGRRCRFPSPRRFATMPRITGARAAGAARSRRGLCRRAIGRRGKNPHRVPHPALVRLRPDATDDDAEPNTTVTAHP